MLGPDKLAQYRKIIVILVDAYTDAGGVSPSLNDPRHWYDYVVDTNFITATDSLLAKNRDDLLNQFETKDIFPYSKNELVGITTADLKARRQKDLSLACQKFFSWEDPNQIAIDCSSDKLDTMNEQIRNKLIFVQINFQQIEDNDLRRQLNNIATNFDFTSKRNSKTNLSDEMAIHCAVPILVGVGEKTGCDGKYHISPAVQEEWSDIVRTFNAAP